MRTLQQQDPPEIVLDGLRQAIERVARLTRSGTLSTTELRATLEDDLELIGGATQAAASMPEPRRAQLLVTLDAVASHLWAAVDAATSGVRREAVAGLLQRAADRLGPTATPTG